MNFRPSPLRVPLGILVPWRVLVLVLGTVLIALTQPSAVGQSTPTPAPANGAPPGSGPVLIPLPPSGQAIASQLQQTVSGLDRAGRLDEIETVVERTMALHSSDWRVLFQGARIYAELERAGYWVNQRFRRGDLHWNPPKGARRVYSHKRDHVRALQLLDRAIRLASVDVGSAEKAEFYWEAAQILTGEKAYLQMYRRTDLSNMPTLDFHEPRVEDREAVPVEDNGQPQFFAVPESWPSARNDGERLLWLLSRARQLNPEYEAEAEFIHAKHLLKAYLGVQTITETPAYDPASRTLENAEEETETAALIDSLDTLSKSESVAVLDGRGAQKFALPEEQNFITRFERMTRDRRYRAYAALALEELAETFENRRQYARAAQYWKALVRLDGGSGVTESGPSLADSAPALPSWEETRLHQIIKSWGRFEDVQPVEVGEPLTLDYWYRNGREVTFTAHRVNVTALVADLLAYLRSDPFPIDPSRISVSKLGLNIVREGGDRYLKEKVSEWAQALTPSEKHWDQRIDVPVPISQPGAYLIEARIDGGHRCSVLVWINDMTILRRPMEDGLFYYVADKKKGTPVGWAKFTFIGYRLALANQSDEPELDVHGEEVAEALQRQYHVLSKEITKWADAKGQLKLDDSVLSPDYRWFLLTSAPNERVAVLGFSDLKPVADALRVPASRLRQFLLTDKSTYLPGQTCHFRGWIREKDPESLGYTISPPLSVAVGLFNQRGETLGDVVLESDAAGGFTGSLALPDDLGPGTYRLASHCGASTHSVEFSVEPGQLAPVRLVLENPVRQLIRGQDWNVTVRSADVAGEPVGAVPVTYRVVRRPHRLNWERDQPHAWLFGDTYDFGAPPTRWFLGWKYWGWDWNLPDPEEDLVLLKGETITGADGVATLTIPTPPMDPSLPVEEDYHLEVRLPDEAALDPATARVTVSERPFKVYAKLDRPFYISGSDVIFQAWIRRYDGTPVTGTGELILYDVKFDAETGKPIEWGWRKPVHPDANGYVRESFPVNAPGQYRASYTVTDAEGNRFEGACAFVAVDESFTGKDCHFNSLEILSDQIVYEPGDRVRLRINTENTGQSAAIFVRPRDGDFGQAEVIRLDQKSTPYEVRVREEDQPSFFVEAIVLNRGEFEVHTKEILVSPPRPLLRATLAADRTEYRPGQEARIIVSLSDVAGEPVAGDLALSVSPASALSASGAKAGRDEANRTPSLAQAFWNARRAYAPSVEYGLKTRFQSFASPPEASMRPIGIFGSVRIGENTEPLEAVSVEEDALEAEVVARPFASDATALPVIWLPSVPVDDSGRAEIPLTMPEIDGRWVVRAWALDGETRVAEASLGVSVKRDWSIALAVPQDVVEGDRVVVTARIRNFSESSASTPIELTVSPSLRVLGEGSSEPESDIRSVEVEGGAIHVARWELEAIQSQSDAFVEVQLGPEDSRETRRQVVRIRDRRQIARQAWNGRLAGGGRGEEAPAAQLAFALALPADCQADLSALTFYASSGLFEQLAPGFGREALEEALAHRPAEELIGAVTPFLTLGAWIRDWDETARQRIAGTPMDWILQEGKLERIGKEALARVWAQQRSDGGWSPSEAESDALATAAVLERLADLRSLEWISLPEEPLQRAIGRLAQFQKTALSGLAAGQGARKRADTLDALTYLTLLRLGKDSSAMRKRLFQDWKKLPILGQVLLAQALHRRGDSNDRNVIRFSLGEKLVKNEESGAIQLQPESEQSRWTWFGSETEVQSRYLEFLIQVKGDAPVTDAAARHLLETRQRPGLWGSHRDSSCAWRALLDYGRLKKAEPGRAQAETLALWQGERKLLESNLSPESVWNAHTLVLSGAALANAAQGASSDSPAQDASSGTPANGAPVPARARLVYTGEALLTVFGQLQTVAKPLILAGHHTDITVRRRYARSASGSGDSQKGEWVQPGEVIGVGETLSVALTVTGAEHPLSNLTFTDHLPAGFELVGELPSDWTLENGVIRGEFPSLPPDAEQEFAYEIVARAPGRFHALPASLAARYAAGIRAGSDEMIFFVRLEK